MIKPLLGIKLETKQIRVGRNSLPLRGLRGLRGLMNIVFCFALAPAEMTICDCFHFHPELIAKEKWNEDVNEMK